MALIRRVVAPGEVIEVSSIYEALGISSERAAAVEAEIRDGLAVIEEAERRAMEMGDVIIRAS